MQNKSPLFLLLLLIIIGFIPVLAQNIVENQNTYYADTTLTKTFTGDYREYYPDSVVRLEMYIENGKPEGTYVVYYDTGRPKEIRSYRKGMFHGLWRNYNEAGLLVAEAEYKKNQKHGCWRVWDDNGVLRYEMNYNSGRKVGAWYMWDEKGKLISEKKY